MRAVGGVSQNATAMLVQENNDQLDTSYVICTADKFSFTGIKAGKGLTTIATAGLQSYLVNNDRMSMSMNIEYNFRYEKKTQRQMTYDFLDSAENPVLQHSLLYNK